MTILRIETIEDLLSIRDEWNALLRASRVNSVFLTHEWLSTWWKHLAAGIRLAVLTIRSEGELVAVAPFAERRAQYGRMMPRSLEFVGSGVIGSDYLDLIVKPGSESSVFRTLEEYMTGAGLMLQLSQLRRGEAMSAEFASHILRGQWVVTDAKINVCPLINLAGKTWESYLASLSSNQRYNFNRRLRALVKNGMRLECATTPDQAKNALEVVIALHRKRWTSNGGKSEAFQTPHIIDFHREFVQLAAERGWLRILSLWLNDAPVAALYGLQYGSIFSFYQSGLDPAYAKQSVGLVLMGLAIKSAIEEGVLEYDFLHGDEEYKFHWSQETRELGRLELYPPHARALVYRRAIDLNRAARKMARRVLAF